MYLNAEFEVHVTNSVAVIYIEKEHNKYGYHTENTAHNDIIAHIQCLTLDRNNNAPTPIAYEPLF